MAKRNTRLQRSTAILGNSKVTEWKYVNADNEFSFMGQTFKVDKSIEEYKVYNKAGVVEDFTNESYMEEILISVGKDNCLKFYNQNYEEINPELVKVKEVRGH